MQKIFVACLLALCMIFSAISVQAYPELNEKPNVAVMQFQNKALVSREINDILAQNTGNLGNAAQVSEFLIKSLSKTKRFVLVEREGSLQVSNELSYSQSGMTNTADAPQIGKQRSAHYLIFGSLTGLTSKDSGASANANLPVGISGSVGGTKRTVVADIIFRFVNVETSEIVLSVDGRGESSRADARLTINAKGEEVYEADDSDSSNSPVPLEGKSVTQSNFDITIGGQKFSGVQVANAIKKAVLDAVYNKKWGLLAELDGTAKGERF